MIVITQLAFALNPTVEGMITTSLMNDAMEIMQGVPGAHVHFETILGIMLLFVGLVCGQDSFSTHHRFSFLTDAIQIDRCTMYEMPYKKRYKAACAAILTTMPLEIY